MADVQKQFGEFHTAIKLDDENDILREKRERVLTALKDKLKKNFEDRGEKPPAYSTFNQGSYAMDTGVKPLDTDYDIDVGVVFDIDTNDYEDPVEVKSWVHDALEDHTNDVRVRRPCVTVFYTQAGEPIYHVDLAIYAGDPNGQLYLAKGKLESAPEYRFWESADPRGLMRLIKERFSNSEEAAQFRRVIRYLKRWRQVNFAAGGHAAPTGIAITVAADLWFSPSYTLDSFANSRRYNDLEATRTFVGALINQFALAFHDGELAERLVVRTPVEPNGDLLDQITNKQATTFKERLSDLLEALNAARDEADPVEACTILRDQFGDDFPIPPKEMTARVVTPPVVGSSSSG